MAWSKIKTICMISSAIYDLIADRMIDSNNDILPLFFFEIFLEIISLFDSDFVT